jgi:hypothetical protein
MSVFVEIEFVIILCDYFSGYIICYRYIILVAIIILCDYFGKLNIHYFNYYNCSCYIIC